MRVQSIHPMLLTLLLAGCDPDDEASIGADAAPSMEPEPVEPPPLDAGATVPDAGPERLYGEFCLSSEDCKSQVCYLQACSEACNIEVANACRDVDAFCIPGFPEPYVCYGSIETGEDTEDDAILRVGDSLTRKLSSVGDADLFHVTLPVGTFVLRAEPIGELDVRLEMYDRDTKKVASADNGGSGAAEQIQTRPIPSPAPYYIVVRHVGSSPSNFTITVIEQ